MRLRPIAIYTAALAMATPLTAQTESGVEVITADAVLRHIGVIANDSMKGRAMPGPGLDKTAQYIADRFQQFGLRPGGDSSGWFQHFPISPRFDFTRSRITFAAGAKSVAIDFMRAARLGLTTVPDQPMRESVLLVAGPHTTTTIQQASKRDKIILYVTPTNVDPADRMKVIELLSTGNKGVVVLSDADTAHFTQRVEATQGHPIVRVTPVRQQTSDEKPARQRAGRRNPPWAAHVQPDIVKELPALLAAGGLDLAQARTDTALVIRELPGLEIGFDPAFDRTLGDNATARNVVGIIEGTDPEAKREYVVVSAHMDLPGDLHGKTDSTGKGYDDNASGIAGLLELAKAFSQPGARPRRSVVFLATSGGAHGYWGTRKFANEGQDQSVTFNTLRMAFGNSVPMPGLGGSSLFTPIANVGLDRIGKNAADSLMVNGLGELKLATPMSWIAAAHPELNLSFVDAGPMIGPESGHYAFVRLGIPSLNLFTSKPDDVLQASDSLGAIDTDHEVRILQYVYYLVQDIANASQRPMLSSEGRRYFLGIRQE